MSELTERIDQLLAAGLVYDDVDDRATQVRVLCADIYRLGLAHGREQAIKEYGGMGGNVGSLRRQVRELKEEIADMIRLDGER